MHYTIEMMRKLLPVLMVFGVFLGSAIERLKYPTALLILLGVCVFTPSLSIAKLDESEAFREMAYELIKGIDQTGGPVNEAGAVEKTIRALKKRFNQSSAKRLRIAVWPYEAGKLPVSKDKADEFNEHLLAQLKELAGGRYEFVTQETLALLIDYIDNARALDAAGGNPINALMKKAQDLDFLITGRIRRDGARVILTYTATRTDGILAATTTPRSLPYLPPTEMALLGLDQAVKKAAHGADEHQRGMLHYRGNTVPTNLREAAKWFRIAAKKGHVGAKYNLGIMAFLGQGMSKDYAKAAKWFRMAGEEDHAAAQYNLGFLYYTGRGVAKDDLSAYTWIARAASLGDEKAQKARDTLRKTLSPEILSKKAGATLTAKKTPEPSIPKPTIAPAQAKDTTPPTIEIASAIQVKEDSPTIRGRVSDKNSVARITVNGVAADVSKDRFSFKRYVPPDGTQVTIEAVDEWGNRSTKVVKLTRQAVQTAVQRFDTLDPTTFSARRNRNAVALIVGIADYKRTAKAKYADRDAKFFSDYARRKLGVPQSNIKVLTNSEAGHIELLEVVSDWLPGATRAEKSDVYVFFAGHGLGSEDGKEVYLLPHNSSPKLLNDTALRRSKLFDKIASTQPRSVTVFLDTCYSGSSRNEVVLLAQRGIVIEPIKQSIPRNFTVFSAAGMKQTAKMLDDAKHGLFSYYLMKGMEGDADTNKDKKITSGELHKYVLANVSRMQRNQTPELQGSANRVLVQW
jgi:TPR repeat protein